MLIFDRWEVRELRQDVPNLSELWLKLQEFPTLFSDATQGDIRNWISLIRDDSYAWYEVFEQGRLVGVIYVQVLEDEADLHLAFFDRKPAEKKPLVRYFCQFLFDGLPRLYRISCVVPAIYYATCRLAAALGKYEGTKRQAVVIGGKRVDVHLYGLLRTESYGIPERQNQRDQHHPERYSAAQVEHRDAVAARAER